MINSNLTHRCADARQPNILVDVIDDLPRACLADFDVTAVTKNLHSRRVPTKLVVWNALWSPPEVLKGENKASKEGDVYSFSMVMIEVCLRRSRINNIG